MALINPYELFRESLHLPLRGAVYRLAHVAALRIVTVILAVGAESLWAIPKPKARDREDQ
jgi:hypothetical protein